MKFRYIALIFAVCFAKLSSASWAITGATTGVNHSTGARPFRLPLQELQESGPMWDLYIQALQFWQSIDQANMFSWYQIGSIHGLPNIAWDDAEGPAYYIGYCTHGSILFPLWHRTYVALHEQVMSLFAHQIADSYPDSSKREYQLAADRLRVPYWDWSTNATIPDVMNTPLITVNTARGLAAIDNPLYRYNFHPYDSQSLDGIYSGANWTVRAPDADTQSQPSKANSQLMANQQQFHDGMYQLFSSQPLYSLFSNTGANKNHSGYQNIENLHNIVHDTIGGTMSYLWVAAFDPIFFLHHANVDRMFTIWQALYPNSFVTPQQNALGTYTLKQNSIEDVNSPLTPFHSDSLGAFFTANTVRSVDSLGYAYREVVDWNVTSPQLTQIVKRAVNQLYNPSGSVADKRTERDDSDVDMKAANAATRQYVLNVVIDKGKINGTTVIHFRLHGTMFGSFAVNMGSTRNNRKYQLAFPNKQAGQVALTHALLTAGTDLGDINQTLMTIATGITWVGETSGGVSLRSEGLENGAVRIQISTRKVEQTGNDEDFPKYGKWQTLAVSNLGHVAKQLMGSAIKDIALEADETRGRPL